MNLGSTLILKAVLVLIALIVAALCVFVLPIGIRTDASGLYRPIILLLYVSALPFFYALYQAFKLLANIDANLIFTSHSIMSLRHIKFCAIIICILFAAGMPYIFSTADTDDAPGVALVGFVIIGASFIIATFAALMQKLIQNAVVLKAENDLTV